MYKGPLLWRRSYCKNQREGKRVPVYSSSLMNELTTQSLFFFFIRQVREEQRENFIDEYSVYVKDDKVRRPKSPSQSYPVPDVDKSVRYWSLIQTDSSSIS